MSIFNPDVKDESPASFIGLSRPASDLRLVSGAGATLKDAGNLIETAAKGTDMIIKTMATNESSNMARTARDAYMDALEAGDKVASGEVTVGGGSGSGSGGSQEQADNTLFGEDNQNIPQEIRSLPQRLTTLENAKNAGKIAQTDYHGRVATMARDIRSRYGSAYWPIIDDTIAQIHGGDPANQRIRGIISMMNDKQSQGRNELNSIISSVRKAYEDGNTALKPVYDGLLGEGPLAGINPTKALEMVSLSNQNSFKAKEAEQQLRLLEASGKAQAKDYETRFNVTASAKTMDFFQTAIRIPEAMPGASPADRDRPLDEVQAKERGRALSDARANAHRWMWDKANADGTVKVLTREVTNKLIDENLKIFDVAIDRVYNKNGGDVHRVTDLITARRNNTELSLITGPMGIPLLVDSVMKERNSTYLGDWINGALRSGIIEPKMQAFQHQIKGMIAGQVNEKGQPVPAGQPFTFNDALNHYEKDGVSSPNSIDDMLSLVYGGKSGGKGTSGLLDPNMSDQGKKDIAVAFFHPKNLGFISRLNPDQQVNFFNKLTSVDVQKEIKRLSAVYPELLPMAMNWTKQTFGSEIFGKEIRSLGEIGNNPNLGLRWSEEDKQWALEVKNNAGKVIEPYANLRGPGVTYQSENQRPGLSQAQPLVQPDSLRKAVQTVNRMNQGLKSITTMYAVHGTPDQDVGTFIIQNLIELGYRPETLPEGLPSELADSIITARKKAKEQSDKKDLNK